jgi:hypothetical protein
MARENFKSEKINRWWSFLFTLATPFAVAARSPQRQTGTPGKEDEIEQIIR